MKKTIAIALISLLGAATTALAEQDGIETRFDNRGDRINNHREKMQNKKTAVRERMQNKKQSFCDRYQNKKQNFRNKTQNRAKNNRR